MHYPNISEQVKPDMIKKIAHNPSQSFMTHSKCAIVYFCTQLV